MFSASLEVILTIAHREASARRHTHLTLEHLLFALAHDPEGEKILSAVGVDLRQLRMDLDAYLTKSLEQWGRGRQREPEQTLSFRRVLQTAVLHVQSAGRDEVRSGDVLAAMLQEPKTFAAQLLTAQGVTRLDILNFISHGIAKVPAEATRPTRTRSTAPDRRRRRARADREEPAGRLHDQSQRTRGRGPSRSADRTPARAAADHPDPLPQAEEQSRVRRRAGRGQDGARRRSGAPAARARSAGAARRRRDLSLDSTALLAGTRFRGDFEERFKAVIGALAKRHRPILFIDEIHTGRRRRCDDWRHDGPRRAHQARLVAGDLRVIGSTTFEEFKHIEKDRALARRLQKVPVEEPTVEETTRILKGLQKRYQDHHQVHYTDAAIDAAARLAARHLRDLKLPDSAIDLIDEAGAMLRTEPGSAGFKGFRRFTRFRRFNGFKVQKVQRVQRVREVQRVLQARGSDELVEHCRCCAD